MRCPSCRFLIEERDAWFCPACEQILDLSVLAKELLPKADDFADQLRTEIASAPRTKEQKARAVIWDTPVSEHTEEVPAIEIPVDDTDANEAKTRIAPEALRAPAAIVVREDEASKTQPPALAAPSVASTPSVVRRAAKPLPPPPPAPTTPVPLPSVLPAAILEPLPIIEPLSPEARSFVPPAALSEQIEVGTITPEVARVEAEARRVAVREPPPLDLPRDTPAGAVRAVRPDRRDVTQKKDVEAILAERAKQRASSDDETISPAPRPPVKKRR